MLPHHLSPGKHWDRAAECTWLTDVPMQGVFHQSQPCATAQCGCPVHASRHTSPGGSRCGSQVEERTSC